ncbi:hypothetical protein INT47_006065, partial [Mucor saturninus]
MSQDSRLPGVGTT